MLADLIATEGVVEDSVLRGPTGVMALHGGLEAGTVEAARLCARLASASLYTVEQPADFRWHLPSTDYDPTESARLMAFLRHVRLGVSFHGYGRRGYEATVLVGGSNERLRGRIGEAISRRAGVKAISDVTLMPPTLQGTHSRNPVNMPEFGGAQIELAPQLRDGPVLEEIARTVAAVLSAEQASICAAP